METCNVCGFRGERDRYIPHDCYWVFRERGEAAAFRRSQIQDEPTRAADAVPVRSEDK